MDSLSELLHEVGVQDTFVDKLKDDGWTLELFSMSANTLDKFEEELKEILGDMYSITTPVQRSAFRLAWTRCQQSSSAAPAPVFPSTPPSDNTAAPSSWSETFPPKLTAQLVMELKQKFRKNYPAEILVPETTPSLRLLSLVHHQKNKSEYKWVPWKFRLSHA